jgi:hypothetical protein
MESYLANKRLCLICGMQSDTPQAGMGRQVHCQGKSGIQWILT